MAASEGAGDGPPVESERRAERRQALSRKFRAAFLAGAEEHSQRTTGRGLTTDEAQRIFRRYPGDLGERQDVVD